MSPADWCITRKAFEAVMIEEEVTHQFIVTCSFMHRCSRARPGLRKADAYGVRLKRQGLASASLVLISELCLILKF